MSNLFPNLLSMPLGYEIREAHLSDLEGIAHTHWLAWKTSYKNIIDQNYLNKINLNDRIAARAEIMHKESGIHLVATFKNKIIGFYDADKFRIHQNQKIDVQNNSLNNIAGEIYALYLLPDHQNLGIGRALFEAGKNLLERNNLYPTVAWVLSKNLRAIKFYEKMGGIKGDEIEVIIGGYSYNEIAYLYYN